MYDISFLISIYIDSLSNSIYNFVHNIISICNRHFLPFRRADLTTSASLQGTRGEVPQLRTLCPASAATSTRE